MRQYVTFQQNVTTMGCGVGARVGCRTNAKLWKVIIKKRKKWNLWCFLMFKLWNKKKAYIQKYAVTNPQSQVSRLTPAQNKRLPQKRNRNSQKSVSMLTIVKLIKWCKWLIFSTLLTVAFTANSAFGKNWWHHQSADILVSMCCALVLRVDIHVPINGYCCAPLSAVKDGKRPFIRWQTVMALLIKVHKVQHQQKLKGR